MKTSVSVGVVGSIVCLGLILFHPNERESGACRAAEIASPLALG